MKAREARVSTGRESREEERKTEHAGGWVLHLGDYPRPG